MLGGMLRGMLGGFLVVVCCDEWQLVGPCFLLILTLLLPDSLEILDASKIL